MDEEAELALLRGTPYVVWLDGNPQISLRSLLGWLNRKDVGQRLRWAIEYLETTETTGEGHDEIQATVTSTRSLMRLLDNQVIELDATGFLDETAVYQIMLRDGTTLHLLGKGPPPTAFELGTRYVIMDPKPFLWE